MIKRVITVLLSALLLLSFTACSSRTKYGEYKAGYFDGFNAGYSAGLAAGGGTEPENAETPTTLPAPSADLYDTPDITPIGTARTFANERDGYTLSVMINSVIRGQEAWELVSAASSSGEEPPVGKEYMVVSATVSALSATADEAVGISGCDIFEIFSNSFVEYGQGSIEGPGPVLKGEINEGESLTGYMSFLVDIGDAPMAVFGRNYDGSGGIWFALY